MMKLPLYLKTTLGKTATLCKKEILFFNNISQKDKTLTGFFVSTIRPNGKTFSVHIPELEKKCKNKTSFIEYLFKTYPAYNSITETSSARMLIELL